MVYVIVQLVSALWYGPQWFAAGDCFETYSTLLARLSPLGRRTDGRLSLRNPLDGTDGTPLAPGLAALATALIGTTAFDGLTRATWFQSRFSRASPLTPTLLALLTVTLVGGLYATATALPGRMTRTTGAPNRHAHSLIPIAAGYAVAHYFSLLVFEGQLTWILAQQPLRAGQRRLLRYVRQCGQPDRRFGECHCCCADRSHRHRARDRRRPGP